MIPKVLKKNTHKKTKTIYKEWQQHTELTQNVLLGHIVKI